MQRLDWLLTGVDMCPVALTSDGDHAMTGRDTSEPATPGESIGDMLENAMDALDAVVAGMIPEGRSLPAARDARTGDRWVIVPLRPLDRGMTRQ